MKLNIIEHYFTLRECYFSEKFIDLIIPEWIQSSSSSEHLQFTKIRVLTIAVTGIYGDNRANGTNETNGINGTNQSNGTNRTTGNNEFNRNNGASGIN